MLAHLSHVCLALAAGLGLLSSAAAAQTVAGTPAPPAATEPGVVVDDPPPPVPPAVVTRDGGRATVRAIRLTTGLRVDGRLDEPVYRDVPPVSDFLQQLPDEGAPATERTDAWVLFDDENFYVAGRCWDSAPPSEWAATDMQRDSRNMLNNDLFGFLIDTFYDRRNALLFYANPLGGFVDQQITNEGNPNRDWNPVWDVRTDRFDGGWTIEMVVPFKSLRYRPTRDQVWGIQLRRTVIRKNEWAYLTLIPISAAGFGGRGGVFRVSAAGTLVGLEAPPAGRPLEVKPYAIGGVATNLDAQPPQRRDGDGAFGVDLKYGVTENLTADLTYNTDFAQVEVDEQQVNLTRFNLFFPEKREFFLEGRGLFDFARGSFRTARRVRRGERVRRRRHAHALLQPPDRAAGRARRSDPRRRARHRQGGPVRRRRARHPDGRRDRHHRRRHDLCRAARQARPPAPQQRRRHGDPPLALPRRRGIQRRLRRRRQLLVRRRPEPARLLRPDPRRRPRRPRFELPGPAGLRRRPLRLRARSLAGGAQLRPRGRLPAPRQLPADLRLGALQPAGHGRSSRCASSSSRRASTTS